MKIKCEWIITNRKGFGKKTEDFTPEQLRECMNEDLNKIIAVVDEKYPNTKIDVIDVSVPHLVKWEARDNEPEHQDVRVDFYISKKGREGIKEKEVYAEVNKIRVAYFTKIQ